MKKSRKYDESKFDFIEEYARAAEEADREREEAEKDEINGAATEGIETAETEAEADEKTVADAEGAEAETKQDEINGSATEGIETAETDEIAGADTEGAEKTETETEADEKTEPDAESEKAPEDEASRVAEDGDEDDDEEELSPETLREFRHKRRIKNEIIAYSGILAVLLIIGVGIGFLAHYIVGVVSEKRAQEAARQMIAEQEAGETEAVVVEAPESVTAQIEGAYEDYPEADYEEETDYLEEMVASTISQMPVEDKVAQMFIVTPEQLTGVSTATRAGEGTRDALSKYAVSGLIYDRPNIESEDQLVELIDNTRNMSKYELFLGIREAGGEFCTLSGSTLGDIPAVDSPSEIASSGEASNAYNAGVTIASYMSYFDLNMDLAPNGSITADEASVSADSSYGSDEVAVCEMITQMINGLSTGSISACMTDFPGTGDITERTADGRVESEAAVDQLSAQIVPYITGAAAGASAIQTNNVTYINADPGDMPASMSEYIIGRLLRGEMAYEGIIITAPLNEKAVTDSYTSAEAVLNAVAAGADIIYMPDDFEEGYNALLEAVSNGTVPVSRIDESLERIFRVKFAGYVE